MNEKPRQAKSIRAQLLTAMREGEYAHCDRLPRESVLSERLGISRTQLRDILASLDREGFITRRHGVGTVINRHVLGAQARMDIEVEFMDMIRQIGRPVEFKGLKAQYLFTPPGWPLSAPLSFRRMIASPPSWESPPERRCCESPGSAPLMAVPLFTVRTWWKNPASGASIPMRSCVSPSSAFCRRSAVSPPIWT